MLDPALRQLIWFQTRGSIRQIWRRVKTPSGAIMGLVVLMCLGFTVLPSLMMLILHKGAFMSSSQPFWTPLVPLILFVVANQMLASQSGQKMMELRAPELPFVLAGPFSPAQVLTYRLATLIFNWGLMSLFFAAVLSAQFGRFLGPYLGIFLGGGFIFSLSYLKALLTPRLGPSTLRGIRTGLRLTLLVIVFELSWLISRNPEFLSLKSIAVLVDSSYLATILSAPFLPFAYLLTGDLSWQTVANGLIGGAMVVVALACCYLFNDGFAELAVEGVARRQERMSRIRGGNLYALKPKSAEVRSRLPLFGWWGGVGPVAWSQLTMMLRRTGRLLPGILLLGLIAAVGIKVAMSTGLVSLAPEYRLHSFLIAMGTGSYLSFLVLMTSQLGFSMNSSLLTWYQALPTRPLPLAIGMATGNLMLLWSFRSAFALVGLTLSNQPWSDSLAILLGFLVLDTMLTTVLNLVPAATRLRLKNEGVPDIFQGVRAMAFMFVVMLVMTPIILVGILAAVIGGALFGFTIVACVSSAALVLLTLMPPIWWLTGFRFQQRELATQ